VTILYWSPFVILKTLILVTISLVIDVWWTV